MIHERSTKTAQMPTTTAHEDQPPGAPSLKRPAAWRRTLGVGYALLAYAGFFASFGAFVLRTMGLLDGTALDLGPHFSSGALAVAFDVLLILAFGLQHSIMARRGFKRWWTQFVPAPLERATYLWTSNAAMGAIAVWWAPVGGQIWAAHGALLSGALLCLGVAGWGMVAGASFLIDHFELFGLKQAWCWARGVTLQKQPFRTPGAYRWVRHPMMSGMLIGLWATPEMTWTRLVLCCGMSCYILVGIYFEERDLVHAFGRRYLDYQKRVSMLLPWPSRSDETSASIRVTSEAS